MSERALHLLAALPLAFLPFHPPTIGFDRFTLKLGALLSVPLAEPPNLECAAYGDTLQDAAH